MSDRGYAVVALDNPKFGVNIGHALRACGVFAAAMLVVSGCRYKKAATDTMAAYKHMPFLRVDDVFLALPYECVPVAIEIKNGATPLPIYQHPERAFYIFGAEDATLGSRVLNRCKDVVSIPSVRCLNLAACVNVVLYDRLCKQREDSPHG